MSHHFDDLIVEALPGAMPGPSALPAPGPAGANAARPLIERPTPNAIRDGLTDAPALDASTSSASLTKVVDDVRRRVPQRRSVTGPKDDLATQPANYGGAGSILTERNRRGWMAAASTAGGLAG